jgi:hypothetical protein
MSPLEHKSHEMELNIAGDIRDFNSHFYGVGDEATQNP